MALHLYAQDYGGYFPPSEEGWADALFEYVNNETILRCPSIGAYVLTPGQKRVSYLYEPGHTNDDPGTERLLFDASEGGIWGSPFFHLGSANVLFLNGQVRSVRRDEWLRRGWPPPKPIQPPSPTGRGAPGR
jgi:hypothetical protein